eukprot:TRINITY_DN11632_c0_g1_i1.p1 TRINITY_DN11632_c0_g1~~TRINITY_DN11632_c0_g1_i1.p1  ORF type:complete len:122 (+),score=7.75 TRINITY_DN11632_c0_g1_i1:1664-2029(+)
MPAACSEYCAQRTIMMTGGLSPEGTRDQRLNYLWSRLVIDQGFVTGIVQPEHLNIQPTTSGPKHIALGKLKTEHIYQGLVFRVDMAILLGIHALGEIVEALTITHGLQSEAKHAIRREGVA